MAFRIFLDTDVLLDFTLKRSAYPIVRRLMEWAINGRVQVYLSPAVVGDTGVELRKAYGALQAQEILLALLASVQMVDAGYETVVNALQSRVDNIAAAISYHTALHHRLDYFITGDTGLLGLVNPVLPVTTPMEFLNRHAGQPKKIW